MGHFEMSTVREVRAVTGASYWKKRAEAAESVLRKLSAEHQAGAMREGVTVCIACDRPHPCDVYRAVAREAAHGNRRTTNYEVGRRGEPC